MRIQSLVIGLFLLGVWSPADVAGWGNDGHRIVGDIAWYELTPESKRKIRDLLPQGRYDTLYEAATWADTYARLYERYDWVKPYHFVNVDPDASSVQAPSDCECVVAAINEFAEHLCRTPNRKYWLRVNDLRLVAHFVGDIHQPLHISHPDGRGGNRTDVEFRQEWVNLHKVWDTSMLRARLAERFSRASEDEWERDRPLIHDPELAWQDYSRELWSQIDDGKRTAWTADMDPNSWATESLRLARQHTFGFNDGDVLSEAYYTASVAVIEERLKQAGVRLGALLNRELASCP